MIQKHTCTMLSFVVDTSDNDITHDSSEIGHDVRLMNSEILLKIEEKIRHLDWTIVANIMAVYCTCISASSSTGLERIVFDIVELYYSE